MDQPPRSTTSSPSSPTALTVIHIVTFNSAKTIERCLDSTLAQLEFIPGETLRIVVTDNASVDETVSIIQKRYQNKPVELVKAESNLGFCCAHNQAMQRALDWGAEFVLVLNPDVVLEPNALAELRKALILDTASGLCCPKLLRADENLQPVAPPRFDSTGIYITPSIRHFDRGSQQEDLGQYRNPEYLFGATGAAMLLRAAFIRDAALPVSTDPSATKTIQLFDEAFFAYREDADLSWRAQWLGWRCRYVPEAIGYHRRTVLPDNRTALPAELNAYSVRNRFLLQLNNFALPIFLRCGIAASFRNLLVIGGVLLKERSSLPALLEVFKLAPRSLKNHRVLMRRKRSGGFALSRWFSSVPKSYPALSLAPAATPIRSLTVIVVNFNSDDHLTRCLRSLAAAALELAEDLNIRVFIADNASSDSSAMRAKSLFQSVREFRFEFFSSNLGFAGAINTAALSFPADSFLILNPDVEMSARALRQLIAALDRHANLGAVSPVHEDRNGQIQLGYTTRALPTLGSTLAELFLLHRIWPKNPWTVAYRQSNDLQLVRYLEREAVADEPYDNLELPKVVEQPSAAALLIRGEAFVALDGFDKAFWPAWFEDVDLCKRLADSGWAAAIDSRARVTHEGGHSLRALSAGEFARAWYPNLVYYWRKHGSTAEFIVLRTLLAIALLLRSGISFLGSLINRNDNTVADEHLELSKALLDLALDPSRHISSNR